MEIIKKILRIIKVILQSLWVGLSFSVLLALTLGFLIFCVSLIGPMVALLLCIILPVGYMLGKSLEIIKE